MTTKRSSPHSPMPLGELLRAAGLAQQTVVDAALARQRNSGEKLGDALAQAGDVDPKDIAAAVELQQQMRARLSQEAGQSTHALPGCLRMGELLVARGDVTREVLNQALKQQKQGKQLGEVLVQMGAISTATLDKVLPLQKRLLSAVLCAGFGFAFAFASTAARAGSSTAQLMISATIAKSVSIRVDSQPSHFTLQAQDVARGYVDVAQPSVLHIKTNSSDGVALEFRGMDSGADVQAVQISGGASAFRMPASGGVMLLQGGWLPGLERDFRLAYRIWLGPQAQPGTYAWPMTVGVSAL